MCTQLNLRNNELEDLAPVAAALRANTTLRSLHLGNNSWAQSGVAELGRAIQTNTTLKVCYRPRPCYTPLSVLHLPALLQPLQVLVLERTPLTLDTLRGEKEAAAGLEKAFGRARRAAKTRRRRSSRSSGASGSDSDEDESDEEDEEDEEDEDDEDDEEKAPLDPRFLNLPEAWGELGAMDVVIVGMMLSVNKTVQTLSLSGASIEAPGVAALAKSLAQHPTLEHLDLSVCSSGRLEPQD